MPDGTADKIKHVFVLMLENRSFDHMLGMSLGTVDGDGVFAHGVGIDARTGEPTTVDGPAGQTNVHDGVVYPVHDGAPFVMPLDPPHEFCDVLQQLASVEITGNGDCAYYGEYPPITLGGFVDNYAYQADEDDVEVDLGVVMSCLTAQQVPVLSTLAREFAVCDRWFSSMPGPTWPNRFFVHAATSGGLDRSPTAREMVVSQFGGYRFENGSIFDALDRHSLPWRVYLGDPLPQVAALSVMTLDTMRSHFRGVEHLHDDLQDKDFAPVYVFIEPNYGLLTPPLGDFKCGNSQHPNDDVARGEALIKEVYEAIRRSPHWESSLLVITYDEHGGFYDHVKPPPCVPPGDVIDPDSNGHGFRFDQLGVRVPTVIVSPWVPRNLVDHTLYDHASLLATMERHFGMPPLTDRDAQANDFLHLLAAEEPRDAPRRLPDPADSGFVCGSDQSPAPSSLGEVSPSIRAFVELAAIVDARLQPERRDWIGERMRAVTTLGAARDYMAEVAARMRIAGLSVGE